MVVLTRGAALARDPCRLWELDGPVSMEDFVNASALAETLYSASNKLVHLE